MRQIKDAVPGFAIRSVENGADIQSLPFEPVFETWRGDEVVEQHSQLKAVFFRIKLSHREDTQLVKGWILNLQDERFKV